MHVYTTLPQRPVGDILDHSAQGSARVPSFLAAEDILLGFAYDPFTDHFFLRLAPGNRIRVVDRPARAIKREFEIAGLGTGGDLSIRPRDGHVFFLEEGSARVTETTRLGRTIRSFVLEGVDVARGIACDAAQGQLLVLHADGRTVSRHSLDGKTIATLTLEQAVGRSLAFDSERQEIYALLATSGVVPPVVRFDAHGKLLPGGGAAGRGLFLDVGPRSFVRVF